MDICVSKYIFFTSQIEHEQRTLMSNLLTLIIVFEKEIRLTRLHVVV